MAGLSRHNFRVDLADGSSFDVATVLADQLGYEDTRARRKWPMITEGGVTRWWSFLAWSAATRQGLYPGGYEQFTSDTVEVTDLDDDPDGQEVDPTRPAAPESLSSP